MKDSQIIKFCEETINQILDLLQVEAESKVSIEVDEEDRSALRLKFPPSLPGSKQ